MIPRRIRLTIASLSWAASLLLAARASALPADTDSLNWRTSRNNCYNYALNKKDNDIKQPGNYPWPSGLGSSWSEERWCAKVDSLAQEDHLVKLPWSEGQPIPVVGADTNLVALAIHLGGKGDAGSGDFHWYRRNGDGTWSQKHGRSPATRMYRDDQNQRHPLTDPRVKAQREGYDSFCGFFGVLKSTITHQQPHDVPPPGGCLMITLVKSGPEDRSAPVVGSGLPPLHAHMPTISAGNQIPDPHWLEPLAGEPRGFAVWPDNPSLGFPPYLRVFQGAVGVYSDLEGTSITYYGDDHGLEAYLSTVGPPPSLPGWTPRASALVALALIVAGAGVLRRRRGEDFARD